MVANTLQLGKHAEMHGEMDGNKKGNSWEHIGTTKIQHPTLPQKTKKHGPPGCMESPHWLQEGFFECPYSLPFLA
jgi:hypothetical protein